MMINNPHSPLDTLFNKNEGPSIQEVDVSIASVSLKLYVPANLSWFEGHFPDHKVLPGVVQVDWAGKLAKALFANLGHFKQLSNVKFKTMVIPETRMHLELTYDASKGNVKFHFFNETESFSMGTFKFVTL